MPSPASAAFVSYSRDDSEFALRLAQDLKNAGAHIWLDQMDIQPGHPWDNAIEDALMDSPLMLLILSPSSARSDNVRNEISFALEQGKTVIPVLYMSCVVPLRLQRTQRIDFRSDYARGLTALLAQLHVSQPDPSVIQKVVEDDAQRQAAWRARELQAQKLAERLETKESVIPVIFPAPPEPPQPAPFQAVHTPDPPRAAPIPPPSPPASAVLPTAASPTPPTQPAAAPIQPERATIEKHMRRYRAASIVLFILWALFSLLGGGNFAVVLFLLLVPAIVQFVRMLRKLKATPA